MDRIAFVFSGQGDQHPGMGKELAEKYPAAADVFAMCDSVRPKTSDQCFFGSEDELKETKNTQPCLFAVELAEASVLTAGGVYPDAVAGFSLGEVTAATFAGAFDRETGFRLVCRRGELMQNEAERFDTSMAAVLRLDRQTVEGLCSQFEGIYPVNFNCPGQISVSGLSSNMPEFFAAVKAAGGRALPLKVKGAFHSPFMKDAADGFAKELEKAEIKRMTIPLYSNVTGEVYADDTAGLLSKQIASPVQWEKTVRNMCLAGIDTFVEIGPGRTLTNMIKKIDAAVTAYSFDDFLAEG